MGTCTKQVVPNTTGRLHTRKDVSKPGQDPRDYKNDQVDLSEALEDLFKLFIFLKQ